MLGATDPETEALTAIGRAAAVLRANDDGDGWLEAIATALAQSGSSG